MSETGSNSNSPRAFPPAPPGTPKWITPELIDHTLRVWQPRYKVTLTQSDAVAMIMNVGKLGELLENLEHSR